MDPFAFAPVHPICGVDVLAFSSPGALCQGMSKTFSRSVIRFPGAHVIYLLVALFDLGKVIPRNLTWRERHSLRTRSRVKRSILDLQRDLFVPVSAKKSRVGLYEDVLV